MRCYRCDIYTKRYLQEDTEIKSIKTIVQEEIVNLKRFLRTGLSYSPSQQMIDARAELFSIPDKYDDPLATWHTPEKKWERAISCDAIGIDINYKLTIIIEINITETANDVSTL